VRVLLDTSVVVAALLPGHASHGVAFSWLSRAKSGAFEFLFSAHSLAEVYAVLTRIPMSPPITPEVAGKLIHENVVSAAKLLALTADEYVALVDGLIDKSLAGGAVYDAVIAKVAEAAKVDLLVTLNVGHFQRVWPTEAARIVSPSAVPAP
jgi:predicted nucleic acid-binding protein